MNRGQSPNFSDRDPLPAHVNNFGTLRQCHRRARQQISGDRLAIADMLLPRLPFQILVADDVKSSRASSWRERLYYAVSRKYIGLDSPEFINAVVLDVDHDDIERWRICGLPPPAWIATAATGRHHIVWLLKKPVRRGRGEAAVMRFLSRVRDALNHEMHGDYGYSGTLTKSPFHDAWNVHFTGGAAVTLTQLYAPVALAPTRASRRVLAVVNDDDSLGRNCSLFHRLRYWAYAAVGQASDEPWWHHMVYDQAQRLNLGTCPLGDREVAGIARSVANWVWHRYRCDVAIDRGVMRLAALNLPLVQKQRMAAQRTATVKRDKSRRAYDTALATLATTGQQASIATIAEASGLSRSTVARLRRAAVPAGPVARPVAPAFLRRHLCHSLTSGNGALAGACRFAAGGEPRRVGDNKKSVIFDAEMERVWIERMSAPMPELVRSISARVFLKKSEIVW